MLELESSREEGAELGSNETTPTAVRPVWSGMLTFGLVSIPVDLVSATRTVSVGLRVPGNAGERLERPEDYTAHDEEVIKEHVVRVNKTRAGQYVPVTDDELEALERKKKREIDLRLFVQKDSVLPLYFERPHLLVPSADSVTAYALLTQALETRGYAGIAAFIMQDREYWVAVFAVDGLLRAETLRFAAYVRQARDVGLASYEKPERTRIQAMERAVKELRANSFPTAEL